MMKLYRNLSATLQVLAVVSWFEVVLFKATPEQALMTTSILLGGAATLAIIGYVVVYKGYQDKLYDILVDHPHTAVLSGTAALWAVPAVVINPWISFAAIIVAYSFMYWSYRAEEKYLNEVQKQKGVFDEYPPF